MNVDEIIMRASAIKLLNKLHTLEDKQEINDECNRIIAICEADQQSVQTDWLDGHDQKCSFRRSGPACTCVRAEPANR